MTKTFIALAIAALAAALGPVAGAAQERAPPARASAASDLPAAVAGAIKASGLPSKSFGLYAQEVIGEHTVFALNADRPYTMASTTKIVTSLAALDLLGPYYRRRTSAFVTSS